MFLSARALFALWKSREDVVNKKLLASPVTTIHKTVHVQYTDAAQSLVVVTRAKGSVGG